MILSSDIFRGHTETMILAILSDGDSYGYEITKNIKEKSEGHCDIRDATIYTASVSYTHLTLPTIGG